MKKLLTILVLLSLVYIQAGWQKDTEKWSSLEIVRPWLLNELAETQKKISQSLLVGNDLQQLKQLYDSARMRYKHVEFFIESCSPREAKYYINGPLVFKHHDEAAEAIPPQGFQRIEELLFDNDGECDTLELHAQCNSLLGHLSNLSNYYRSLDIPDAVLFGMLQPQLFRIASMNLSGYDATISQTNVLESYWSMEGIETVARSFKFYAKRTAQAGKTYKTLLNQLSAAKKYLYAHPDYDTFNRLEFIVGYINPLNQSFVAFHKASGLPPNDKVQAIDWQSGFLFGKEDFNKQFFSIYYNDTINISGQAELGKLLFFDPVLSGNNRRACAGCHNPSKAFTDGLPTSIAFEESGNIPRNAPGLLNVIYQKAFFVDGRAYQLEQQVFDVLHNKREMQGSLDDAVSKLRQSSEYRRLFSAAFSGTRDSAITEYSLQKAIAEYEKTLVSFNSRFDRYLHGDFKQLDKREINGYNLFAGKALCGSCHFFPLFNSTVPPFYDEAEYEVIGTPSDSTHKQLDADIGRYAVTRIVEQKNAFKTPTVRNIELTAPYMHNGIYTTLEQVVEFYHKGGGAGLKISVPNQTLPFDSLKLTVVEKEDIVLFLKTLTDTVGTSSQPLVLPAFENNALLNKRKPGGDY